MKFFAAWLYKLKSDKKAATAIEYGLIATLICVVIILAVAAVGNQMNKSFNIISSHISKVDNI